MSASQKGKSRGKGKVAWNKGLKMNDDFCKKVSEGKTGKLRTEESINKQKTSMKEKYLNDPTYRQHLSDAVKQWWENRRRNA